MALHRWEHDPKLLGVMLARYKFVAKLLEGMGRVLEVGCADGFGSRVVRQNVGELLAIDIDREAIEEARHNASTRWPVDFQHADIMYDFRRLDDDRRFKGFDAVYCLDLFEHIIQEEELLQNLHACAPVCIIGTPSLESQRYASAPSKTGHVNCKSGNELKASMLRYWRHVFMFSMSDETVHTGFMPMAHYLVALGTP